MLSSKEVELKIEIKALRDQLDSTNRSLRPVKEEMEEYKKKWLN